MKRIVIPALTLLLVTAPCLWAADESREPVDFSLQQLHGETVTLSDFRPKWVVLNYWATWCAPCRKEIPELSDLNEAREDVVVLGLAFEDTEMDVFDEFLAEFEPSYQILLVDVFNPPEPFGAPKVLPTTIILDGEGYPVKTFLGPVTRVSIESFIDAK
ncbi:MAG: TlpA disulfide reductase family protein [Lysobacterales bacterium]